MPDPAHRAAPPGALRVEPLGELTAIFDRRSMQTHLVVSPMPEILEAMGCRRLRRGDARGTAGRQHSTSTVGDDVQPILVERLSELAAMGLVERA